MTTTKLESRIQKAACEYIDLTPAESEHYHGCGALLFAAKNGEIIAMQYFGRTDPADHGDSPEGLVRALLAWAKETDSDEIWYGDASTHQICNPRRLDLNDASDLAFLARAAGELYRDDYL